MDAGIYGPDSVTWRLTRERAMLLGGARALLMQLAHPLVAAGVHDHSNFRADPFQRLNRTLDATLSLVFGGSADARRAAAGINAVHGSVRGTLTEAVGRYPAGTPYDARDPDLLLWVHATLIDTTLLVYPRFVAPLDPADLDRAYEESKVAARMLGVPDEILPPDLPSFRDYMDLMLASDEIAVGGFQRELAASVLWPPVRFLPRPVMAPVVALTASLLPERLRDAYGLRMSAAGSRFASAAPAVVRRVVPLLPPAVRFMPQARRAVRRTAQEGAGVGVGEGGGVSFG